MVKLFVPGVPVPQPRPKVSTINGMARAYVPASHPVHAYRAAVAAAAKEAFTKPHPAGVPLSISAVFSFSRPSSHFLKGGNLRKGAPLYPGRCDNDNLLKAVQDAMEGIAYHNDSQIVHQGDILRVYDAFDGTEISLSFWPLAERELDG